MVLGREEVVVTGSATAGARNGGGGTSKTHRTQYIERDLYIVTWLIVTKPPHQSIVFVPVAHSLSRPCARLCIVSPWLISSSMLCPQIPAFQATVHFVPLPLEAQPPYYSSLLPTYPLLILSTEIQLQRCQPIRPSLL